MKKLMTLAALVAAFFILGGVASATTVSGHVFLPSGGAPTTNAVTVRFVLKAYGQVTPRVTSAATIATPTYDFVPDNTGYFTGTIYGNDVITPSGTYYQVVVLYRGQALVPPQSYNVTGTTWSLDTATAMVSAPTPVGQILSAKTFEFTQSTPATTWTIVHNFGDKNVVFSCYGTSATAGVGTQYLIPDTATETDINTLTITFVNPQAGTCNVMTAGNVTLTAAPGNAVITNPNASQTMNTQPLNLQGPLNMQNPFANTYGGVFTNAQYNPTISATVNGPSGVSCPAYVLNEGGSGSYATDAMTGCMIVPSTSSVISANAVAGYIIGSSPSTGCGQSGTCTVAGYFSAQAGANGVLLWGINPACNDQSALGSFTNVHCQNEFDQNITSTTTSAIGAAFTGYASVSNQNTVAVEIQGLAGPYPVWWTGFQCNQGSVGSQTCLAAYPISNSNNVNSQNISMTAKSSGGVPLTTALLTNPTGNFQILPASGNSDYFLTNNGGLQLGAATGGAIRLVPPSTSNIDTFNYPDTAGSATTVCVAGVTVSGCSILPASLTTTAATSDNVTITGMTSSGHCSLTATNSSAATNIATTYISAKTTNQITVTHTATGSMTYDILCTPN